jgi:hypothetical protein
MNRRKMLEDAAKGAQASTQQLPTIKTAIENSLLQPRQMVNPGAMPQMANPAAARPMVNPAAAPQGLMNIAAAQPQVNMGAAPTAPVAPTAMMADGGLSSLMPADGTQGFPGNSQLPNNYPQSGDRLNVNYGGLAAVPVQGMFNQSSYAGGGIVAFEDNPDQPVSLNMPDTRAVTGTIPRGRRQVDPDRDSTLDNILRSLDTGIKNTASGLVDRLSNIDWIPDQRQDLQNIINENARINNPELNTNQYSLSPEAAERIANTTELPTVPAGTSPDDTGRFIAADAAVTPGGATPSARVNAAPGAAPSVRGGAPSAGGRPSNDLTDADFLARRQALLKLSGVSEDPYAAANKRQAAIEARQQEKYARDPFERLSGSLAAYARSDPTKGMAGLGVIAETSNAINKEQTAYRDKQEQAALDYEIATAKEKDARARDDVKSVEAARSAQEKAKIDWAKLDIDRAQLGVSAANANIKALEYQLALEKAPLQRQLLEAQIKTEADKIPSAEEKSRIARARLDETVKTHAERAIEKDETIKYWSGIRNSSDPKTAAVINSYLEDLKEWHMEKARNPNSSVPKPPPLEPGKKKTGIFGNEKKEFETTEYVRPNASPAPSALPPGLPPNSRMIGTYQNKPVYQTPDGKQFTLEK